MDNLTIRCDEIIESFAKLSPKVDDEDTKTNYNKEKATCKTQILLAFLWITIALLIAVSSYYCLIKYQAKQKHLLAFYDAKLKLVYINNLNWRYR